jgi:hypothetical protein
MLRQIANVESGAHVNLRARQINLGSPQRLPAPLWGWL